MQNSGEQSEINISLKAEGVKESKEGCCGEGQGGGGSGACPLPIRQTIVDISRQGHLLSP